MSGHFTFPACRRIARFFSLTFIPKYDVADILSEQFVEDLAREIYRTNNLTEKSERLAQSMFWVFYKEGILALEIMVCGMLPPEKDEPNLSIDKEVKFSPLVGADAPFEKFISHTREEVAKAIAVPSLPVGTPDIKELEKRRDEAMLNWENNHSEVDFKMWEKATEDLNNARREKKSVDSAW